MFTFELHLPEVNNTRDEKERGNREGWSVLDDRQGLQFFCFLFFFNFILNFWVRFDQITDVFSINCIKADQKTKLPP